MKKSCNHRRIKKNYPFGHKSVPRMFCKDCGEVIKPKDVRTGKQQRKERKVRKAYTEACNGEE